MKLKKVCVGMSGGVDSSTTAHLLIEAGYDVFGATMYLFDIPNEAGVVGPPAFIEEAKKICDALGIIHHVIDLRDIFKEQIMEPFKADYLAGLTPNPCTRCNRKIKYGLFMDQVLALGADAVAMGHYVRIVHDEIQDSWHLLKGLTHRKDQSYYLHGLSETRLSQLILPLGTYSDKDKIRAIASRFHQGVSEKRDSLGVCFTGGMNAFDYLQKELPDGFGHGNFILNDGTVIGMHDGYYKYTRGQKKGLPQYRGQSLSVIDIIPEDCSVVIGSEEALYADRLYLNEVNWIHEPPVMPWRGIFKIFTWGYDLSGQIEPMDDGQWRVVFDAPVRAIAKGQSCVFYKDDEILGGGVIIG